MNTNEEIVFKSNGWQAINRMGIINENYHTLILNYRELMNEIVRIQLAPEPFLLLFHNENLNRYIFNFLASTSALIDSCRSVMNFYKNTEIHEHYTKNIKEQFANNSIAVFIKDLRNYQMHYKTTFPYLTSDKQICFETYEFKQYDRWSKLSKEFIKEQGDFIILKPLFETYFKNGGVHFQLTYISKEELIAAKKEPQKYGHLRVRVSGFSDYFTHLNDSIQNDIILRTDNT